ncbi:putative serine protease K12H4.7 [Frankliniella occidentalis]|uniref:Serine protease K12H4.7 n=1 Tax=Frankliniella occidentalis TaxID=133901 RepID=A0A6J1SBW3_FRAOC|nr:putative serine protease K12H4.7 [Frankliniella occidentalis]
MRVLGVLVVLCVALAQVELASVPASRHAGHAHVLPGVTRHNTSQPLKFSRHDRHRRPPPPVHPNALRAVKTEWFDQLLDHFDISNAATWQQRYFSNDALYEEDGPVFLFIEGESEAQSGWIAPGGSYMYELAQLFKARMYVLEHRFFGKSKPTKDISSENLKFLSSDQALADLAYFIEYLIAKGEMKQGQKLAVFGGSYPGNLAAWARLKYPHLVHAAVASSAPVHAEEDFKEYMEVVSQSIRTIAGNECADNVKKGFDRIKKLLLTTDGLTTIQNTFYMCDPPNTANKLDMDIFYEIIANPFAGASQYNRDGNSQYSLKAQCQYMAGDLTEDEAVTALGNVFYASQGWIFGCIDWSYKTNTKYLSDVSYSDGSRQWVYMTCAMFGYFQTADGDTVFPKGYFDVPYFVQQCKDAFGENYNDAMVKKGVERTNTVFGSWNPDVENVMFVNGKIDPWHALSVLEDVNDKSPAVLISSTSHCYDMYANDAGDSAELRAARDKIKQFVTNALYEGTNGDSPTLSP